MFNLRIHRWVTLFDGYLKSEWKLFILSPLYNQKISNKFLSVSKKLIFLLYFILLCSRNFPVEYKITSESMMWPEAISTEKIT